MTDILYKAQLMLYSQQTLNLQRFMFCLNYLQNVYAYLVSGRKQTLCWPDIGECTVIKLIIHSFLLRLTSRVDADDRTSWRFNQKIGSGR